MSTLGLIGRCAIAILLLTAIYFVKGGSLVSAVVLAVMGLGVIGAVLGLARMRRWILNRL